MSEHSIPYKELTPDEMIAEAKRIAEYSTQGWHTPDYRTSVALSSIALSLAVMINCLAYDDKADSSDFTDNFTKSDGSLFDFPIRVNTDCTCLTVAHPELAGNHHDTTCPMYEGNPTK